MEVAEDYWGTSLKNLSRQTTITLREYGHRSTISVEGRIGVSKGKNIDFINFN